MKPLALVLLVALAGCCPKVIPPAQRDSIRVEYRDRVVMAHDTVTLEVPEIVERIVTRDTISHLENDWAKSDAVVSDGFLHHSLNTIPHNIYIPVEIPVEVHDTISSSSNTEFIDKIVVKTRYPNSYWILLLIVSLGLVATVRRVLWK